MIAEGLKLMALGMGIVFIFLILLMLMIILSSRLFKTGTVVASSSGRGPVSGSTDEILAVISAAISSYRNKKNIK